jgi:hypothetical protein
MAFATFRGVDRRADEHIDSAWPRREGRFRQELERAANGHRDHLERVLTIRRSVATLAAWLAPGELPPKMRTPPPEQEPGKLTRFAVTSGAA